jgi:dTDP-4-amino-4,6-dideoxygalactose transaminase
LGCTSFFPSKNLGCYGDGGAIITNDDNLAMKMNSIVNHGAKVKYYHESVGVNSRLDSIQAAILRVKLKHLDQYITARQKVADNYDQSLKGLQGIKIPSRSPDSDHVFHQYTLILDGIDRKKLVGYLRSNDIPTMVYYPVPLHLQEAYSYLNYKKGDFPVTEYLCDHVLSLPMHTELEEDQIQYIVQKIHDFINNPSG